MTQDYSTKSEQYFAGARTDIASLLPGRVETVLEVGCGTGATLRWLKESGLATSTTGIEVFRPAAQIAQSNVDRLFVGDAETILDAPDLLNESFDVVLCLDVLEHLVDPWGFVSRITAKLKTGGTLIVSVPNVRHLSVLLDVVLRGRWDYGPEGILDRTHLRFFTRSSAQAMVATDKLRLVRVHHNIPSIRTKAGALNLFTFGLLKDFLSTQFVLASTKS